MFLLAILAAASAWLVTRKAPQHRPLAWALTVCAWLDAVRLLGLPARVDMALCLVAPAASAVAATRVFEPRSGRRVAGVVVAHWTPWMVGVLVAPNAALWWFIPIPYLTGVSVTIQGMAALFSTSGWTISQRVALILIAGDALAVASLCAREWISNQAGVVLVVVTLYQVTWWWRWRRAERS